MHDDDDALSPVLGRRQLLHGATALSILGLARLARQRPVLATGNPEEELDVSDLVDASAAQSMCVLTPSAIEGPYYLDLNLVRSDITEGYAGIRTRVNLHVVHAAAERRHDPHDAALFPDRTLAPRLPDPALPRARTEPDEQRQRSVVPARDGAVGARRRRRKTAARSRPRSRLTSPVITGVA